jgi:di/tricarboxylate transporter
MSSTGTVAVLLPAIIGLARSINVSPSRLLIPVSFGALLGGATTLIGTPPNIIVSDLMAEQGMQPFSFFSFTPLGLLLVAAGVIFMVTIGRRMLPDNKPATDVQRGETSRELVDLYHLGENLFRLRMRRDSELTGQTIADSRLRNGFNVTVVEILRAAEPRPVARLGERRLVLQSAAQMSIFPRPDTTLCAQDILLVRGEPEDVQHAAAFWNLAIQPARTEDEETIVNQELGIAEVLLPPRSSLVGQTLEESRFGVTYSLNVLGINRHAVDGPLDLRNTVLEFGDILLVQGTWENIRELRKRQRDFVVIGQPEAITDTNGRRAPAALLVLVAMLLVMITGILPLVTVSIMAAIAMVLTRCLTMDEAYDAIDWRSVVLIAGMLPMATALEKVGLVDLVVRVVVDGLGTAGPLVILGAFFLMTSVFTQVLSNTATTVLLAPIALATANQINVDPHAFMMAVAVAASMAFASPVASPTNTLILSAGNYRFVDFFRLGVPMILIMLIVTLIALPVIFPFYP